MPTSVAEQICDIPSRPGSAGLLTHFQRHSCRHVEHGCVPIRFAVTSADPGVFHCEFATLCTSTSSGHLSPDSIFRFHERHPPSTEAFNVVLLVPTGIGAEIGGHAGDAGPVARLFAELSDRLLLHPNVVNASDINELPSNAWYVEGSVLARLLAGTVGLLPSRLNRVLVVADAHPDPFFVHAVVNAASAARATYGLSCPEVVCLQRPVTLRSAYSPSGRAAGRIEDLNPLLDVLESRSGQYDAVALSSVVTVPIGYHQQYFDSDGSMVNPWGGIEAVLTHALSLLYDVPVAHSPMLESREVLNKDPGIVDPRMAAEAVSSVFLQCILKGLHRSPRIVRPTAGLYPPNAFTASDVSCLVIPDGCLGIPTVAALQQGIPVVAVANRSLMSVDLDALPWRKGQLLRARNYYEAAGIVAAMRAGIDSGALDRPMTRTRLTCHPPDAIGVQNHLSGRRAGRGDN